MGNRKRRKLVKSPKTTATTKNSTFQIQGDEAAKILRDKVFSISLVTDCIFHHMSFSDLLCNCSLVSKNWDSAVKDYLRRCRTCLYKCNLDDFNELENQLQILKNPGLNNCHPFSGIILFISPSAAELKQRQSSSRKSILRELFSLIEPTHIVLTLEDYDSDGDFCRPSRLHSVFNSDVDIFISNVLFRLLPSYDIKHLSFIVMNDFSFDWHLWLKNVGPGGFATLETIQPITRYGTLKDFTALLRACPNLKDMPINVSGEALMTFDKYNKLALVKHLSLHLQNSDARFQLGTEGWNVLGKLKNDSLLSMDLNECSEWTAEEFQSVGRIIQLHSKSLKRIKLRFESSLHQGQTLTASTYENMFQLHFPALPFVKRVEVWYGSEPVSPQDDHLNFENHPHLKIIFPHARILSIPERDNIATRSIFILICYPFNCANQNIDELLYYL